MRRIRSMIKAELAQAYKENPRDWFPAFDSTRIDSDAVFFWNVWGDTSDQMRYIPETNTHYDNRIMWKIGARTPENILNLIWNRISSYEWNWNIAFIMKDQNGTDCFIYYEAWILKYVFPTTTWGPDTPDNMIVRWWYHRAKEIEYNDRQLANYYDLPGSGGGRLRWPMPYSRRLCTIDADGSIHYEWINTHIGNVGPWEGSHGCARQGALWACILFHTMMPDTIVYNRPEVYLQAES